VTETDIEKDVNVRESRLRAMLKVLEVEGAVERVGRRWQRTLRPWQYDAERVAAVTATRRAEQAAMGAYADTDGCRMAFLRGLLDDPAPVCGRCDNCTGAGWDTAVKPRLAAAAAEYLRHADLPVEPRRMWIGGPAGVSGRIPPEWQLEPGRALSVYGDGGWGREVRRGKAAGAFRDELVEACAELVENWRPDPPPTWVTCVPSSAHPGLVPSFAAKLAARLGLEFHDPVRRVRPGRPQKDMENSAQQLRNVYGAFEVVTPLPVGPALLVDDIMDSRWTITTIGVLLRQHGSGPVFPLVLAKALSS
jgi:ATP-dependent DNA helicase RecQ